MEPNQNGGRMWVRWVVLHKGSQHAKNGGGNKHVRDHGALRAEIVTNVLIAKPWLFLLKKGGFFVTAMSEISDF